MTQTSEVKLIIRRYLHKQGYCGRATLHRKQRSRRKVVGVNRSIRQLKARRYRRDITQAPVSARPYKLRLCANGACPLKICTTLSSQRTSPSHIY